MTLRVSWVAQVGNSDCVIRFITTAWFVWHGRNSALFGNRGPIQGDAWTKASLFLSGTVTAKVANSVAPSSAVPCWAPPAMNSFKANVDAALDLAGNRFSAGIIIWDCSGRIVRAAALVFDGRVSVEVAEAKAIFEGLRLASNSGLHPLTIESDSLNVVKLCTGLAISSSDVFNVISDIQTLLSWASAVSISHIPRQCNMLAHETARWAIGLVNSVYLEDPFPPWLLNLAVLEGHPSVLQ